MSSFSMAVKRNILLNPGPATTTDTVKYALVVPDICPREKEFCHLMTDVKRKLVKVVNGTPEHEAVLFTASGTGGIEAAIGSLVPPGKKLMVVNNGAYGERMCKIAARFYPRKQVVEYKIPYGKYPNISEIKKLMSKHEDLSHIGIVHHETTTGMLNPVKEIAKIAHDRNIEMIVDTVSSYAGIHIDIEKDGFDYIVSTSNKNIQGMAGIVFVITRKDKLLKTADYPKKNFYFNLFEQFNSFEQNGQMQFTPAVQVIYALNQALDEFFQETPKGRYERYSQSWKTLTNGLEKIGFKLFLPKAQQARLITAVHEPVHNNYSFDAMHDYLYQKDYTIYPGKIGNLGTFRIANIGAIDKNDIQSFLKLLDTYIRVNHINLS